MVSIDDYKEVKECIYKEEHYSARDNGAIMRYRREGKPKRKYDEAFSFGIPNPQTGYMMFCGERVHRIVATAFHGPAPTPDHVVDHIDTNRQNNRPENLRWCTRLENALNNPITRKKIEYICGSVDAFLENPQLLWGHEMEDSNFMWMRTVTKEEARNCLANLSNWANSAKPATNYNKPKQTNDDWMFDNPFLNKVPTKGGGYKEMPRPTSIIPEPVNELASETQSDNDPYKITEADYHKSSTPSALQAPGWRTQTEFPCCPKEVNPSGLKEYEDNLKPGVLFTSNEYDNYYVIEGKINKKRNYLFVLSTNKKGDGYYGAYSVVAVEIKYKKFVHVSMKRFGNESDATKFYKFLLGEYKLTEDEAIMYLDT